MKKVKANLNTRTRFEYQGQSGSYKRVKVITHRWSVPATPEAFDAMLEQGAAALDPLAFHTYKEGECLPRGHEMDGIEKVNEVQGFRRCAAIGRASKVFASIGITRPTR
jgi:hypothetical protein